MTANHITIQKKYIKTTGFYTIIILLVFFLSGCGAQNKVSEEEKSDTQVYQDVVKNNVKKDNKKTQIANPASVYCEENNGKLEMRTEANGTVDFCILEDGTECEEWAYYRGDCKEGDVGTTSSVNIITEEEKPKETKEVNNQMLGSNIITINNIKAGDIIKSPVTIAGIGYGFESTLQVELRNSDHEAIVKELVTVKSQEVGVPGPFSITLNYEFSNTKEGYIAVYDESAKDGSELYLVEIPVIFE